MKRTGYLFFLMIIFTHLSLSQTHIPPGNVSGSWTFQNSPYFIQGNITIPTDSTLTIEPGVLVEFQGHYALNVQGRLLAVGTETDTIIFTINDTSGFSNPEIPSGGWHGIRFNWTPLNNDTSKIIYCKLGYGKAVGSIPNNMGGAIFVDHFSKLIISKCNISHNSSSNSGGAILLYYSSPVITENIISHNSSANAGGIGCSDGSNAQIRDNIISNNYAQRAGGISFFAANSTMINTIIENNKSIIDGGGILVLDNSKLTLRNVKVQGNTSGLGGGIHCYLSDLDIDSSSLVNNSGGAIRYDCGGTTTHSYKLNIKNTLFSYNTSQNSQAGCLSVEQQDSARINVMIDKCTFSNNKANSYSGLTFEGNYLTFNIGSSIFSHNEADVRSTCGMFVTGCSGTISNCLFHSNSISSSAVNLPFGCIGVLMDAEVDLWNCTFANNSAPYAAGLCIGAGGMASVVNSIFHGNHQNQIALDTLNGKGGRLLINYSDIQDGKDSVKIIGTASTLNWGEGNIADDPLFWNSSLEDYHLKNGSPCLGTGIDSLETNGLMQYCSSVDIESSQRPAPAGSRPDMGAYESPEGLVGIDEFPSVIPDNYTLFHNYPNPFNPVTSIGYGIKEKSNVKITVFNALGEEVAEIVNEKKEPGYYNVKFNAVNLSSGVYFYRLTAGLYINAKKMILIK